MKKILIYAPGADFLMPYLRHALPGTLICGPEDADGAELAVMISSCDIYGPGPCVSVDESAGTDNSSPWVSEESTFMKSVSAMPAVVLRCADIVGTGMTGFPRALAESVWRGTFFHFPDNEARRSVVHASDIASIIALMSENLPAGTSAVYNLTDGADPTIHDLAEALAFRMKNKRISTLSTGPQQWFGRKMYGPKRYGDYTTTRTFSSGKLRSDYPSFVPSVVTEYLRTHNYDETSL